MGWIRHGLKSKIGNHEQDEEYAYLETRGDLSGTTVVVDLGSGVQAVAKIPRELLFQLVAMVVRDARTRKFEKEIGEMTDEQLLGIEEE
jgi:hypothetical protein